MRHPSFFAAVLVAPFALALAVSTATGCGEDSRDLTPAGGGAGGGAGSTNGDSGAGGEAPASSICAGATAPTNAEICPATGPTPNCAQAAGKPVQLCGVLAKQDANTESSRTTDTEEYAGTGNVDTACFEKANWKTQGESKTVTVKGFVRNFSSGCDAKNVKIEIFTVKRGGDDDGMPDQLVGNAVTTAADDCTGEPSCKLVDVEGKCANPRIWRAYEYPGVPTETELLVKTSSPDGSSDYAPLYDFNFYISNDEPGVAEGTYDHPLRAVVISDFSLIPQVAYGSPITSGNGAVAGEIHDCGDVRVTGATFGISRAGAAESYFTDVEAAPLPESGATSTSTLGLYSAYDLTPGPVRVVAAARVGGVETSLGYYDVRVFPNAITSMTFRGFRPFQAAAAAPLRRAHRCGPIAKYVDLTTSLLGGRLVLAQPAREEGFRVTIDALLVAREALESWRAGNGRAPTVLDLGAGTGVIGLTFAAYQTDAAVTLVEREAQAATLAFTNAEPFAPRVRVIHGDVAELGPGAYDVVLCNPPYFRAGPRASAPRRELARHGALPPFLQTIARSMDTGRAWLAYPSADSAHVFSIAAACGLAVTSLRLVYPRPDREARLGLFCLERTRNADGSSRPSAVRILAPLIEWALDGSKNEALSAFARGDWT
jgi:tRNA1(Val) A37 N6-methylase TrmN6